VTRYYVVVDIGRDPETGRRKQKWHSGHRTKREAESALNEILSSLDRGSYVEPSRLTVKTFLQSEWLPSLRGQLRPATLALHSVNVSAYLVPNVGDVKLQALTPGHLNRLYGELLEHGRRDGSALSPSAVKNVHKTIRRALTDAFRWGHVARNVADLAQSPSARSPEMETWNADQLRRFLDHITPDRLSAVYLLAATTGMRRGEVLGLRWRDVDLEWGRASTRQTLVLVKSVPTWSEPKTAKSRRSVPLAAEVVTALRAHRAQLEERLLLGPGYSERDLVFCRPDGEALHPATFTRSFERHVAAAGVPPLKFHGLRHTLATVALRAGEHPKVVSEILGHSSIAITLDLYSHATPSMQEEAAGRVARLFLGSEGTR
jgi:integrase